MLKMRKSCSVPFPEKLSPAYQIKENHILANIDADKLEEILTHFITMHDEPLFFILEIPTNNNEEPQNEQGITEKLHNDVYYIDGCDQDKALAVLRKVGELVINDGLCNFGFGCHISGDEIMVGAYNVVTVFTGEQTPYHVFFAEHGIPETDALVTAWDTFSKEHPGMSGSYSVDGKSIYDIPEILRDKGIYFAERREQFN